VTLFLVLAADLGPVSRFVPLAVAVPTLAILILQLLVEIRLRLLRGRVVVDTSGMVDGRASHNGNGQVGSHDGTEHSGGVVPMALWVLGLFLLVFMLGFAVALPTFALAYLRIRAKEPWRVSTAAAVAMWALVYLFFGILLDIPMHAGHLWGWLGL
jgi:hypothetical protein